MNKITIVEPEDLEVYSEATGEYYTNFKSNYYIINGLGQYVFFHSRSRQIAQTICDEAYGKGFYLIHVVKQGNGSGEYTARG